MALLEPEIAGNVGQIGRTCQAAGCTLHLIRPLGFRLDDRALRRAGMDYWEALDVRVHAGWSAFRSELAGAFEAGRVAGFTTRAAPGAAEAGPPWRTLAGHDDAVLLFGPESRGLPEAVVAETLPVRLPMVPGTRSLNLAAAVAAAVYLAWSARGFDGGR